jgi:hypothetical protein
LYGLYQYKKLVEGICVFVAAKSLTHFPRIIAAEMCKMLKVPVLQRFERFYFVEKQ